MIKIKLFIATDHAGVELKKEIINYLNANNIEHLEIGIDNNPLDDYPDFAFKLGKLVVDNSGLGILICGNGIGISIAANKVKGVRCARILNEDDAFKCKNHNGSNVIALSSTTDLITVKQIIDTFLMTKNPSEKRHLKRVNKIIDYELGNYNEL